MKGPPEFSSVCFFQIVSHADTQWILSTCHLPVLLSMPRGLFPPRGCPVPSPSVLSWLSCVKAVPSKQSVLKEINHEYSLEELKLKLKIQYFGHLIRRADSLEKTLMLGKMEGQRRKGQQRMRWLESITNYTDMNWSKLLEIVKDRKACCKESDRT